MSRTKNKAFIALLAVSAFTVSIASPAFAKNKATEFLKYFNPVPEKSYLNKSQDREIKKRKFKVVEVKGASPVYNKEIGYFAIVPFEKNNDIAFVEQLLDKPEVNGVSVLFPWYLLNPKEDEYNWNPVDQIVEKAKAKNKSVILRVSTCGLDDSVKSDSPDWVLTDEVKQLPYTGADGKPHIMPIFWDSTYLARWSNFIAEMADKYDDNSSIHSIGITGGGVLGSTSVVPNFVTLEKKKDSSSSSSEKASSEKSADEKKVAKADESASSKDEPAAETKAEAEEKAKDDSTDASKDKVAKEEGDNNKVASKEPKKPAPTALYKDIDKYDVVAKPSKENRNKILSVLKKDYGMSERQLIEHWKYVADMFPKYFEKARLNFDINPPVPTKAGQSALDEISDYLVYRYGQRVYLTRQKVKDGKHGFNEYRVLLKFHPDTLTGYRISENFDMAELDKLVKNAKTDGISFCELPPPFLTNDKEELTKALADIRQHMGYQLVSQQVELPKDVKVGEPIKASFTFVNLGAATAMKPDRQLDKDVASSYKVQLELRNAKGKPVVRSLHTPDIPTNEWAAGEAIVWDEDLKMPKIKPGKYNIYLSLIDTDSKRKLNFLNAMGEGDPTPTLDAQVGSIEVIQ